MKIFIIGGGASGLTTAINAARSGAKVTILEKNAKCCKKVLLTGNGRCNFWNEKMGIEYYHTSDKNLLKELLLNNQDKVLDFIKSLGIVPRLNNGYYYPFSNQAISLVNALINTALKLKVEIKYEEEVVKIEKKDKFIIYTKKNIYEADKVVLATGGKSYPKTGSDGFGYKLAKDLGHTVNKPLPALVQLRGAEIYYKDLKGVRTEVDLLYKENNKEIKKEHGEILFTDYGISGICTFNLSGEVARGLDEGYQEEILIDFVPWFQGSDEELLDWFANQAKNLYDYSLGEILEGFLNYKIVNLLLKLAKVDFNSKWENSPKTKIINLLRHFSFKVVGTNSFMEAEVTSGGIPLSEVNIETMESLKTKGLYLVGELLDVDGICGGYNLGFAWMSGLIAAKGVTCND